MVQAFDRSGVLSARTHRTTGVVTMSGRLTRPGLLPYSAHESPTGKPTIVYRSASEVFSPSYLDSVRGSMVSADHKFTDRNGINAGLITSAAVKDGHVEIEMMITDKAVSDRVFNGVREISAGYTYDYSIMTAPEIAVAMDEYPEDYKAACTVLGASASWIRAYNLENNHVSPVVRGRAGATCAIDQCTHCGAPMDETIDTPVSDAIPTEGEVSTVLTEKEITDMMSELFALAGKVQHAMESSGMSFDSAAFASDRAGYLTQTLTTVGVKATDESFGSSIELLTAYGQGYAAGKAVPSGVQLPVVSEVKLPTIARDGALTEELQSSSVRSAWDKLTRRVTTK